MRKNILIFLGIILLLAIISLLIINEVKRINYFKNYMNHAILSSTINRFFLDSLFFPSDVEELFVYMKNKGVVDNVIEFYKTKIKIKILIDSSKSMFIIYGKGFLNIDNKAHKKIHCNIVSIRNYFSIQNDIVILSFNYKNQIFNLIQESAIYSDAKRQVKILNNEKVDNEIHSIIHKYYELKFKSYFNKQFSLNPGQVPRMILLHGIKKSNKIEFLLYNHNLKYISESDSLITEIINYLNKTILTDSIKEIYFPIRLIEKDQVYFISTPVSVQ